MDDNKFHNDISRELGGINKQLESLTEIKELLQIQNSRLRKLEDWKLKVNTKVGMIACIMSGLVSVAVILINKVL